MRSIAVVGRRPGGRRWRPGPRPTPRRSQAPTRARLPVASRDSAPCRAASAEDLAALVDVQDLTPLAILVSLAIAFGARRRPRALAGPRQDDHGRLPRRRAKGSSRQAVGLGLAVTVSHTLGVLALAGITLAASSVLPPERLYPILGVASGGLVIAIGGSLLWSAAPRACGRAVAPARARHDHAPRRTAHEHAPCARSTGTTHGHAHPHAHAPAATPISWRGLLALGLSGGLVPSASALILLLGSIAAGRVAYGLVLVLGFGLGMAVVLAGHRPAARPRAPPRRAAAARSTSAPAARGAGPARDRRRSSSCSASSSPARR